MSNTIRIMSTIRDIVASVFQVVPAPVRALQGAITVDGPFKWPGTVVQMDVPVFLAGLSPADRLRLLLFGGEVRGCRVPSAPASR